MSYHNIKTSAQIVYMLADQDGLPTNIAYAAPIEDAC